MGGAAPPENLLGVGGESPALLRPVGDSGQEGVPAAGERSCPRVVGSLRGSHDPGRGPPQRDSGEEEVKEPEGRREPAGADSEANDALTQSSSLGGGRILEDLEQSASVSDVSARNVDAHSHRDSDATESDAYDSDESESASSFASIVDLLKDGSAEPKGAATGIRRAVALTLKVPNAALVAATSPSADVEDDLEVIDAGVDEGVREAGELSAPGRREQRASTWTRQGGEQEEEGVSKGE